MEARGRSKDVVVDDVPVVGGDERSTGAAQFLSVDDEQHLFLRAKFSCRAQISTLISTRTSVSTCRRVLYKSLKLVAGELMDFRGNNRALVCSGDHVGSGDSQRCHCGRKFQQQGWLPCPFW